jgi:hypothetical protein
MRDLEDEARIKAYMEAKMKHIKMYNECMNLADGLDVEKFAELVRADERSKREWVGFTSAERDEIVPMLVQSLINHDDKTMTVLLRAILIDVEAKLKEKNT